MIKKLCFIFLSFLIIISCDAPPPESEADTGEQDIPTDQPLIIDSTQMGSIIQDFLSFSPVEMAALIKESGAQFTKDVLMPTDNSDSYDTNFKQALGLGMLGVDLGYINMYEKKSLVVNHITIAKKMADAMGVGQFLEFETIKDIAVTNGNIDSLLFVTTNSFNRMDSYLREKGRNHLSTLIVTGVWLEGLYLATQVVNETPNEKIAERIGEQKNILDNILILLKNFKSDKNFASLNEDLEELKQEFKPVRIHYEIGEPKSEIKDGKIVIIQSTESIVEISDEQLTDIINKTEQIRNKLIGL